MPIKLRPFAKKNQANRGGVLVKILNYSSTRKVEKNGPFPFYPAYHEDVSQTTTSSSSSSSSTHHHTNRLKRAMIQIVASHPTRTRRVGAGRAARRRIKGRRVERKRVKVIVVRVVIVVVRVNPFKPWYWTQGFGCGRCLRHSMTRSMF